MRKLIPFCLSLVLLLSSCGKKEEQLFKQDYLFGTTVSAYVTSPTSEQMETLFDLLEDYDALTDAYHARSIDGGTEAVNNVYVLNKTENDGVTLEVDPRLAEILQFGLDLQKATEYQEEGETYSYFNPLIGSLSALWKEFLEGEKSGSPLPSEETRATLVNEMRETTLVIEGNKVTRSGKGKIDVGAFAKGFALAKAQDYLIHEGLKTYFVSGGDSSIVAGSLSNGKPYTIRMARNDNFEINFPLSDGALGVSGVEHQHRHYLDKTYTHIVNPKNGDALTEYDTVLVTGKDSGICDVLSTVLMIGGEKAATSLQKEYDFGYLIYDGEKIIASDKVDYVSKK